MRSATAENNEGADARDKARANRLCASDAIDTLAGADEPVNHGL